MRLSFVFCMPPSTSKVSENLHLKLVGANCETSQERQTDCAQMLREAAQALREEISQSFAGSSTRTIPSHKMRSTYETVTSSLGRLWGQKVEGVNEGLPLSKLQNFGRVIQEEVSKARSLLIALVDPVFAPDYASVAHKAVSPAMLGSGRKTAHQNTGSVILMAKPNDAQKMSEMLRLAMKASESLGGRMAFLNKHTLHPLPGLVRSESGEFSSIYADMANRDVEFDGWYLNSSREKSHFPGGVGNDRFTLDNSVDMLPLSEELLESGITTKGVVLVDDPHLNGQRTDILTAIDALHIPSLLVSSPNFSDSGVLPTLEDLNGQFTNIFDVRSTMTPTDARTELAYSLGLIPTSDKVANRNAVWTRHFHKQSAPGNMLNAEV